MKRKLDLFQTLRATPGLWRVSGILRKHGILRVLGSGKPPPPHAVRTAIEELGSVFMKFGQVLALRRDLLPDDYIRELESLQNETPPVAFEDIRSAFLAEFGSPPEELFAEFDSKPLATGTIAQAHLARTHAGLEVVVKVRRPMLAEEVRRDLGVLSALARLAAAAVPGVRGLNPTKLVEELGSSLRLEIDFREEAANIVTFRERLADVPNLWMPDALLDLSGETVLTQEYSCGVRVDRYAAAHPDQRQMIVQTLASLLVRQVFEKGLFHADPHPGNLFVFPDGRLCLHDFGMVGSLREDVRISFGQLLMALVGKKVRAAADAYIEMGIADETLSRFELEEELSRLIEEIHNRPPKDVSVGQALGSLVRIGSRRGLRNPSELLLLTRVFLIMEGVLRAVDPEVDILALFRAEMSELEKRFNKVEEFLLRTREWSVEMEAFVRESPGDARRVLRRLADGTVGRMQVPVLEARTARIARSVERLTSGVIAASFVLGGALLVALPGWHHALGIALLLLGGTMAIAVAFATVRRARDREND